MLSDGLFAELGIDGRKTNSISKSPNRLFQLHPASNELLPVHFALACVTLAETLVAATFA